MMRVTAHSNCCYRNSAQDASVYAKSVGDEVVSQKGDFYILSTVHHLTVFQKEFHDTCNR